MHVVGLPTAGLPPVDPDRPGTPDMPLVDNVAFGGSNGTICKYSTFMGVAQLAKAIDIPIIASGGLENWRDFVSAIMWGASGVSLCSTIMWYGWRVVKELNEDLADYMAQHGYKDWQDFRGLALSKLTTPDKIVVRPGVSRIDCEVVHGLRPVHAAGTLRCDRVEGRARPCVDEELCIGCGVCRAALPGGGDHIRVQGVAFGQLDQSCPPADVAAVAGFRAVGQDASSPALQRPKTRKTRPSVVPLWLSPNGRLTLLTDKPRM